MNLLPLSGEIVEELPVSSGTGAPTGLAPLSGEIVDDAGPGALARGFMSGVEDYGPGVLANLLEGGSYSLRDQKRADKQRAVAHQVRTWGEGLAPDEYKRRFNSLKDIHGAGDFLSWLGESVGNTVTSMAVPLVGGLAGAGVGGSVAGPPGAVAGGAAGAFGPSVALNYSDIYGSLKDEGIEPKRAAELAEWLVWPVAGLDLVPINRVVGNLTGQARKDAIKSFARRMAKEGVVTGLSEGATEAGQAAITSTAGALETGDTPFSKERVWRILDEAAQGTVGGAAVGTVSGVRPPKETAPPPPGAGTPPPGAGTPPPGAGTPPPGPSAVVGAMRDIESGGTPPGQVARNSRSSATGDFGFIDSTWLDLMTRFRPDLVKGKSRNEILALRADGDLSAGMAKLYADKFTAPVLRQAGIEPTPPNLYLGHFLGPGGARAVLTARPAVTVDKLLTPAALTANPGILTDKTGAPRTAAYVVRWANHKMRTALASRGVALPGEDAGTAAQTMVAEGQEFSDAHGGPDPVLLAEAFEIIHRVHPTVSDEDEEPSEPPAEAPAESVQKPVAQSPAAAEPAAPPVAPAAPVAPPAKFSPPQPKLIEPKEPVDVVPQRVSERDAEPSAEPAREPVASGRSGLPLGSEGGAGAADVPGFDGDRSAEPERVPGGPSAGGRGDDADQREPDRLSVTESPIEAPAVVASPIPASKPLSETPAVTEPTAPVVDEATKFRGRLDKFGAAAFGDADYKLVQAADAPRAGTGSGRLDLIRTKAGKREMIATSEDRAELLSKATADATTALAELAAPDIEDEGERLWSKELTAIGRMEAVLRNDPSHNTKTAGKVADTLWRYIPQGDKSGLVRAMREVIKANPLMGAAAPAAEPAPTTSQAAPISDQAAADATAELAKLGITITESETPKGAKMWEVRGIGKERAEALREKGAGLSTAGLRWYGPKKVWSAPQSKGPIAEKLLAHLKQHGGVEAAATAAKAAAPTPAPTSASAPPAPPAKGGKSEWRQIGVNEEGNPVFEDERGVRSYTRNGIRFSEPVELVPTREGGRKISVDKARRSSEYKAVEEMAAEATPAPVPEPAAPPKRIVSEDAYAAAKARLRNKLRGGQLSSGIDPEILTDGAIVAAFHIENGVREFAAWSRKMIADLGDEIRPFLKGLYNFARDYPGIDAGGMSSFDEVSKTDIAAIAADDADAYAPETAALSSVTNPTQDQVNAWLSKALSAATGFTNNEVSGDQLLTRTANAMGLDAYKRGTEEGKVVEEVAEAALVGAYEGYVNRSLRAQKSEREVFDGLVRRYNVQPTFGTRTSTSAANQAYSTPAPLAYMVGRLVSPGDTILEPTAGTGMLLIGASDVNGLVNEIDPLRAKLLRAAGESPTTADATGEALAKGPFDAVLMNPPFGKVSDSGGNATWMAVKNDAGDVIFRSKSIDQAIAVNAAQRIKPGGMVALIMAGPSPQTIEAGEKARTDHYAAMNAAFHLWMHRNFDIGAHFTALGRLYRKQGAAWPIDVIIGVRRTGEIASGDVASIQGRLPANSAPTLVDSWDGVYDALVRAGEWKRSYVRPASEVAAGSEQSVGQEGVPGESAGGVAEGGVGGQGATRPADRPVAGGQGGVVRGGARGGRSSRQGEGKPGAGGIPGSERDGGTVPEGDRGRDEQSDGGGTDGLVGSVRGERSAVESIPQSTPDELDPLNENELQSTYVPSSVGTRMDTLTPKALSAPAQYALRELRARVGDIHEFVRKELQYTDQAFYDKAISAEMRDALGLAIDNLKRETGFVIGDQTGVGKGRFVAGILRWARLNGHIPVFMTEKPGLYSAMLRDLWDIGERDFKAFPTNKDLKGEKAITAEDPENKMIVAAPMDHGKILDSGALPPSYHGVFTTYDQMNTRKGKMDRRHQFLANIASKAIFVLDESHNAVGQGITDAEYQQMIGSGKEWLPREILIRDQLLRRAKGAVFSSATFAKRPTAMMLYEIKTDIGLAAPGVAVSTLLSQGGVPMQQAMSALLVKSGQMARREKSFEGVEFHEPVLELDVKNVDNFSDGISDIADFDRIAKEYIKNVTGGGRGAWDSSSASVESAISSTEFTSIMHNIVDQASAAMKADAVAEMVIAELDAGRKPVVAFDNTMGSLLAEMVAKGDAAVGQPIDFGLHTLLQRYLARTLRYTVKPVGDPNAKPVEHWFPVEDMSPQDQAQYHALMNRFQRQFGDAKIPGSPIDWVAYRLGERGIKIGEITGRDYRVDYKTGTLQRRDSADRTQAGKLKVITKFNGGTKSRPTPADQRLDAIILNRSGSTGISLHASELFGDQRQRVMVLAQFEKNIDTFIQLLGRVNRTGQVSKPIYYIPSSNVPAENRLLAVLKKKLISLQANVTASGKGQIDIKKVPDFINEIGGTVINEMVSRSRTWQQRLRIEPLGKNPALDEVEAFSRRVTGRVSLLHIAQQQTFYNQLLEGFDEEVKLRRGMGQQIGAAELLPMDAKPIARQMYWPKDGSRIAQGAVYAVEIDAKLLDPIPTWESAFAATQRALNGEDGLRHMRAMLKDADREYDKAHAEMQEELDRLEESRSKMADTDGGAAGVSDRIAALTSELKTHEETWDAIKAFLTTHYIGSGISMTFGDNPRVNGLVTNVYRVPGTVDPASFSAWRVEIIFASRRPSYIKQTLNRLPRSTAMQEYLESVKDEFRALTAKYASGRERRIALMGNTVRAFARSKNGQIVQLTDAKGRVSEAVLLPFEIESLADAEQDSLRFLDAKTAARYMAKTERGGMHIRSSRSDQGHAMEPVRLSRERDDIKISIETKGGRRYYANPAVINALAGRNLVKSPYSGAYEGYVKAGSTEAQNVIGALMSAAPEGRNAFHPVRDTDTAREIHGLPKGQSTIEMDKGRGLFEQMDELLLEDEDAALPLGSDTGKLASLHGRTARAPGAGIKASRFGKQVKASLFAWHASPHEFEKFDMAKVGTGEGAQVFGHGLYFAESKETAEYYRRTFSGRWVYDGRVLPTDKAGITEALGGELAEVVTWVIWLRAQGYHNDDIRRSSKHIPGDLLSKVLSNLHQVEARSDEPFAVLWRGGGDRSMSSRQAIAMGAISSEFYWKKKKYGSMDEREALSAIIEEFQSNLEAYEKNRAYYEYQLNEAIDRDDGTDEGRRNVHEARRRVMDIDRAIEERSDAIDALKNGDFTIVRTPQTPPMYQVELSVDEDSLLYWDGSEFGQSEKVLSAIMSDDILARVWKSVKFTEDGYDKMFNGGDFYESLSKELGGYKEASAYLLNAGIDGIKYVDGATRNQDFDYKYNYVVFSDERINIVGKHSKFGNLPTATTRHDTREAVERIRRAIIATASQIAPSVQTRVYDERFEEDQNAGGFYWPERHLIEISLSLGDPTVTVRHEAVHALRALGMFSPQEWTLLGERARRNGLLDRAKETYADLDMTDDQLLEEAIAQDIAEALTGGEIKAPIGPARAAINRVIQFFRKLRNALRGLGFRTVDDLHQMIESGEIGARGRYGTEADAVLTAQQVSNDTSRAVYIMRDQDDWLRLDLNAKRKPGESLVARVYGDEVLVESDRLFNEYMRQPDGITDADRQQYGLEALRQMASTKASRFSGDPEIDEIAAATFGNRDVSLKDRIVDTWREWMANDHRKLKYALADRLRGWYDLERSVYGDIQEALRSAYKGLRMATRSAPDIVSYLVHRGPLEVYHDQDGNLGWRGKQGWDAGGIRDIVEPLADKGLLKLWEVWKVVRRAERLDTEGREKLLKGVADERKMTVAELSAFINRKVAALSDDQRALMHNADERWQKFNHAMLDFAEATHLIRPEDRALYEHADYIPFYRLEEDKEDIRALIPGSGTAGQHIRSPIRRLTGGEQKINAIVENMIANASSIAQRGVNNLARLHAFAMAEQAGVAEHVTTQEMMRKRNVKLPTVVGALRKFGWDVDLVPKNYRDHLVEMWLREQPDSPDVASVMRNGKPEFYRFADPDLIAGLISISDRQFKAWIQPMAAAKRLLTKGVTATPPFMARNFVRDTTATWMMTGITPGWRTVRALMGTLRHDETYWKMMSLGATGGGFYSAEATEERRRLDRANVGKGKVGDLLSALTDWWTRVGEASEMANRRAVFEHLKARGASDAEAAYHAVDLLDFGLHGGSETVQAAIRVLPFLNARIQGLYRLHRAFVDPTSGPLSEGRRARMTAGMTASVLLRGAMMAGFSVALEALLGDDDDYQNQPEWKKDTYWTLPGGVMIPKPFEFGLIFATGPQRIYRAVAGKDRLSDTLGSGGRAVVDTLAINPLPQLVRPAVEQGFNVNFFTGGKIVPTHLERLRPSEQYLPYTSVTMKELGQLLNVSPVRLEALVRGYTGDMGLYVLGATDGLVRAALGTPAKPDERIDLGDFPGLDPIEKIVNDTARSFFAEKPARTTKSTTDFYDLRRSVEEISNSVKLMRKEGRVEDAVDLRNSHREELQLEDKLSDVAENLSKIRKRENMIYADQKMSGKEKRKKLDELSAQRNNLTKDVMSSPAVIKVMQGIHEARP